MKWLILVLSDHSYNLEKEEKPILVTGEIVRLWLDFNLDILSFQSEEWMILNQGVVEEDTMEKSNDLLEVYSHESYCVFFYSLVLKKALLFWSKCMIFLYRACKNNHVENMENIS